jgi:hypothetical protein
MDSCPDAAAVAKLLPELSQGGLEKLQVAMIDDAYAGCR